MAKLGDDDGSIQTTTRAAKTSRKRVLVRIGLVSAPILAALGALVIHPHPLFAYSLERRNIVLHARVPLPKEAGPILDEAIERVARSPLYDPRRKHDIFLCDSSALYEFLTFGARGAGLTRAGTVFIRGADMHANRLFDPQGKEKTGERDATYVLAHELTHAFAMDRFGAFGHRRIAAFQSEGYADYVGFERSIDLHERRKQLRDGDPAMDVGRSGLYLRYETLVAYLIDVRGMAVEELLGKRLDRNEIEREFNASDL